MTPEQKTDHSFMQKPTRLLYGRVKPDVDG